MKAAGNGSFHLKTLAFLAEVTLCFFRCYYKNFIHKKRRTYPKFPHFRKKYYSLLPDKEAICNKSIAWKGQPVNFDRINSSSSSSVDT